jgi:hypothetical protein
MQRQPARHVATAAMRGTARALDSGINKRGKERMTTMTSRQRQRGTQRSGLEGGARLVAAARAVCGPHLYRIERRPSLVGCGPSREERLSYLGFLLNLYSNLKSKFKFKSTQIGPKTIQIKSNSSH